MKIHTLKPGDVVRLFCYGCNYQAEIREIDENFVFAKWYQSGDRPKVEGGLFIDPVITFIQPRKPR